VIVTPTDLAPACLIDLAPIHDSRGSFTRSFCSDSFAAHGLPDRFVQTSISHTNRRGTLRGLHWQEGAAAEGKLVCCVAGAVFDVMVDLRADQPTCRAWLGYELSAANRRAVYVPPGFAHGMQALTDDAVLLYQMTAAHRPGAARGARWDDPAFAIAWPIANPTLSVADAAWPAFPLAPPNDR
jgi:dTDP-4-dehydrorhamnose 3,5-epimerase